MSEKLTEKNEYARFVRQLATDMTILLAGTDGQAQFYFDNGFNVGGSNPITDEDIAEVGITAAQVGDMVNFMQQLNTWISNGVPVQAMWSLNLNQTRYTSVS